MGLKDRGVKVKCGIGLELNDSELGDTGATGIHGHEYNWESWTWVEDSVKR